jgi:hypothetical protein
MQITMIVSSITRIGDVAFGKYYIVGQVSGRGHIFCLEGFALGRKPQPSCRKESGGHNFPKSVFHTQSGIKPYFLITMFRDPNS